MARPSRVPQISTFCFQSQGEGSLFHGVKKVLGPYSEFYDQNVGLFHWTLWIAYKSSWTLFESNYRSTWEHDWWNTVSTVQEEWRHLQCLVPYVQLPNSPPILSVSASSQVALPGGSPQPCPWLSSALFLSASTMGLNALYFSRSIMALILIF